MPYLQCLRQQHENKLLISAYGHLMTISRIFFGSEYHRHSRSLRWVRHITIVHLILIVTFPSVLYSNLNWFNLKQGQLWNTPYRAIHVIDFKLTSGTSGHCLFDCSIAVWRWLSRVGRILYRASSGIEMGSGYCDAGHARDGGYQETSSFREVVQ